MAEKVVYGGLARFFACKDEVADWMEVTEYTLTDPEDIKYAEWMGAK